MNIGKNTPNSKQNSNCVRSKPKKWESERDVAITCSVCFTGKSFHSNFRIRISGNLKKDNSYLSSLKTRPYDFFNASM